MFSKLTPHRLRIAGYTIAVLAVGFAAGAALFTPPPATTLTTTTTLYAPQLIYPFSSQTVIHAVVGVPLPLVANDAKVKFTESVSNPAIATLAEISPANRHYTTPAVMPLKPGTTTLTVTWYNAVRIYTIDVTKSPTKISSSTLPTTSAPSKTTK